VFLVGLVAALGRGPGRRLDRRQRFLAGLLCFNIAFVAVVGNLMELGENNRFRSRRIRCRCACSVWPCRPFSISSAGAGQPASLHDVDGDVDLHDLPAHRSVADVY
jgi:hypothetical protein